MSYEVVLDEFQGPLDLLLHLIKEKEMDLEVMVNTERGQPSSVGITTWAMSLGRWKCTNSTLCKCCICVEARKTSVVCRYNN